MEQKEECKRRGRGKEGEYLRLHEALVVRRKILSQSKSGRAVGWIRKITRRFSGRTREGRVEELESRKGPVW